MNKEDIYSRVLVSEVTELLHELAQVIQVIESGSAGSAGLLGLQGGTLGGRRSHVTSLGLRSSVNQVELDRTGCIYHKESLVSLS